MPDRYAISLVWSDMDHVSLIALMPLKYGGVRYKSGGKFTATRAHARVLKAIKKAADAPAERQSPTPTATPLVQKAEHYETTDLKPESDQGTAKTPRTYRRKDITATS